SLFFYRKDICAGMNRPCETLGLSHLSGMCQPHRSCNINEDSGLPVAFTIAHELGHSFGIQHDGQGNDCEPVGRHPFIMSRQLQYDPSPLTWSHCSKEYITRFLDRGWGFCLDDPPAKKDFKHPFIAPGVLYDVHHQCQLQYGPNTTFCEEVDNVCQTLWCSVKGSCRSKLDSAADGTRCGEKKWCFSGECVTVGKRPDTVNGGWGDWSSWSHCTRTCGAGVQSAERQCNKPKPQFGGKYCTGERKRYRICNTKSCLQEIPTFREMQCSEFDTVPYKNELYTWIPVYNTANPCELHCRPTDENFAEKMLDAAIDGTPCYEENNSRDICINGICKGVGCDYRIDSNAVEDRCGVCLGNGSACQTVQKMFDNSEGLGYVDVGFIPKGARDITVEEIAEAGNFLALRSEDPEKYYLNGGFIIQWNGDYKVAGTTFKYERFGNLENLTAPGPTKEPLWIQLLFQETNPGVRYEYTVRKDSNTENDIEEPEYHWQYGPWTECSALCGKGIQQQIVHCMQKKRGIVEERFCDPTTRPDDKQKNCKKKDCPARWWAGEWQKCSATCGPSGLKKRTVLCIRTVGIDEQALQGKECQHLLKPKTQMPCNRDILCPSNWTVGNWSQCAVTCGGGLRTRSVLCVKNNKEACDISKRPNSKALCGLKQCPPPRKLLPPLKPIRRIFIKVSPKKPSLNPNRNLLGKISWPRYIQNVKTTTQRPDSFSITTTHPATHTSPSKEKTKKEETVVNNESLNKTGNNHSISDTYFNYNDIFANSNSSEKKTIVSGPTRPSVLNGEDWVDNSNSEQEHTSEENFASTIEYTSKLPITDSPPKSRKATPSYRYDYITESKDSTFEPDDANGSTGNDSKSWNMSHKMNQMSKPNTRQSKGESQNNKTIPISSNTLSMFNEKVLSKQSTNNKVPKEFQTGPTAQSDTVDEPIIEIPLIRGKVGPADMHNNPNINTAVRRLRESLRKLQNPGLYKKITNIQDREFTVSKDFPDNHTYARDRNLQSSANYDNPKTSSNLKMNVYWIVGNWSECSTTCGHGAIWRHVECNTKTETDCQTLKKPDPARRCYLRPCVTWKIGNWSKCSENCGGGIKTRDVQCIDAHEKRPLRPFHCQLMKHKPASNLSCNNEPCTEWHVEPWSKCSKKCGGGIQERDVFCPEHHYCNGKERPKTTAPCNKQPCSQWAVGSWSKCS
uniref:Peptidase M12B domain-containing protein n=1 Tax=Latimeria chalumnae TaxID=7897 RepID=H3AVP0_LATCH